MCFVKRSDGRPTTHAAGKELQAAGCQGVVYPMFNLTFALWDEHLVRGQAKGYAILFCKSVFVFLQENKLCIRA